MNNTNNLVILDKREYAELMKKAAVYDVYARKIAADKERNGYVSEYEAAMFVVDEPTVDVAEVMIALGLELEEDEQEEDTEDTEYAIPDKELEQIAALVEEEEEE